MIGIFFFFKGMLSDQLDSWWPPLPEGGVRG